MYSKLKINCIVFLTATRVKKDKYFSLVHQSEMILSSLSNWPTKLLFNQIHSTAIVETDLHLLRNFYSKDLC